MKRGYKHKTGVFGDDAEIYISRLLLMHRHPQGSRRPDLISLNGRFAPKLSIEVKSGRSQKGVMVDYQLHYAITCAEDYVNFLGAPLPKPKGVLPGIDWLQSASFLRQENIAYHYWLVNRIDKITADDLNVPFAAVKLKWGNICSAPHQYAFAGFAAAKACRTKKGKTVTSPELKKIVCDMKETIKHDLAHRGSDYEERKKDPNSWQDLHMRDFLAVFHGDNSLATPQGQERIRVIREVCPQVDSFKRIEIPGPNGTRIHVLAEPDEFNLFDKQVRQTVEQRNPVLEEVIRNRARAESLLEKISFVPEAYLFENGLSDDSDKRNSALESAMVSFNLTRPEIMFLDNAVHWRASSETAEPPNQSSEEDTSFNFGANRQEAVVT